MEDNSESMEDNSQRTQNNPQGNSQPTPSASDAQSQASESPSSASPENQGGQKADAFKNKFDEIISKGLSLQDPRATDLLQGEIDGLDPVTIQQEQEIEADNLPKWLQKFNKWHRHNMSDFIFLLWLAVVVGIFAGFGAHIFNRMIYIVSHFFLTHIQADKINWWLIFPPILGIVLTGIYTRYVVHTDLTHGVTRLMHSVYKGNFLVRGNLIYSPIIGGSLTLGLGGTAGSEGPIALSGAAIGSNLGRWLKLKMPLVKILLGCGAAAGISGIFQSPVGGLLFTIEFLKLEIGTLSILAVMLSCLMAYGIVFVCNGCEVPSMFRPEDVINPDQYGAVLLLGFLCGLYSIYYTQVINQSDHIFIQIKNPWYRNIIGGFIIGLCLLLFPALYGVGYPVVSDIIHQQFDAITKGDVFNGIHMGEWGVMLIAFLILVVKCWGCGACNASGGVSSDFAPTLYAGAIAGFLFAYFCNTVIHTHLPISAFILVGMAAVMAGCIEAPMMTIFIVINMGTDFRFMLAVILAVYSSYITVRVSSHLRGQNAALVRHLEWFYQHQETTEPIGENG